MVKKNVLTPVLAGVLGLSIVGSGVGYFVMNKNAEEASKDKAVVSPKLSVMAENISNTLDKAEGIISGEVDYAYEGSVTLTLGSELQEEMGVDLKDLGMTVSSRQKGGIEGGDIALTYDGKTVVTINEVYSRENSEEMYMRIPELSDAYIKVSKDKAEELFDYDLDVYVENVEEIDFDAEAFEADLKEYEQVIKDNFPEVKENGKKSGEIDGVSYEYTSKTYEITGKDAQNIFVAVLEKAKADENLKKLYDQGVSSVYENPYVDEEAPSYEESIDEMLDELKGEVQGDEKIVLETYENKDEEFMGFTITPDGEDGELRFIVVSNDDAEGIDMMFDTGDGSVMTVYGAMKAEGDSVSGSYYVSVVEDGVEETKMTYTVSDLKAVGENFAGTIEVSVANDNGSSSSSVKIVSNSTADDVNVSFDFANDGESFVTLTVEGRKTEASDVELPGDGATIYDILDDEQQAQYLESCDVDGFLEKVKDSLGEDLYNELFVGSYGGYDDFDYDYDWDDDFDWDDYDWDDDDFDISNFVQETEDERA